MADQTRFGHMTSIIAMIESNRIRVWSRKNSQSLIGHGSLRRANRLVGRGIAYRGLRDINRGCRRLEPLVGQKLASLWLGRHGFLSPCPVAGNLHGRRAARTSAWVRAFSRGPLAFGRRYRNRVILRGISPWLRK